MFNLILNFLLIRVQENVFKLGFNQNIVFIHNQYF